MSTNERMNQIAEGGSSRPPKKSTASGRFGLAGIKLSTRLLIVLGGLALICLIPLVLADDAPNPIATSPNGTCGVVNGSIYVDIQQPLKFGDQPVGGEHDYTLDYTLPEYSDIKWARLYAVVYSGSGTNNWPVDLSVYFDGGDGEWGDPLGEDETLATPSSTDGYCYWVNDHCSKVYSDYLVWYDVTNQIVDTDPRARVISDGGDYDGRIKAVALVVAYNTSSSNSQTYYWVNQGQEWFFGDNAYPYRNYDITDFDVAALNSALNGTSADSAFLRELSTSSKDATYKIFDGSSFTPLPNYVSPGYGSGFNYFNNNTWDVTGNLTNIPNTVRFYYENSTQTGPYGAGSYQIQLAILNITKNNS